MSGVTLCYKQQSFSCRANLFLLSDLCTLCLDSDVSHVFATAAEVMLPIVLRHNVASYLQQQADSKGQSRAQLDSHKTE